MASRTPTGIHEAGGALEAYLREWATISERLREGESWSGRERNCAYRNLGNGSFEDISGISGLDLADDGRAVVSLDWDGDGDLDLWFKNRSGPQLRLLLNGAANSGAVANWVSLELVGLAPNTDAVGARVRLLVGERTLLRAVRSGEGYLAQPSRRLHFGLGDATAIDGVRIRWPDGYEEEIQLPELRRSYRVIRNGDSSRVEFEARHARGSAPAPDPTSGRDGFSTAPAPIREPIVLRTPLPLPPGFLQRVGAGGELPQPTLVNLWAEWCAPCREELTALAERRGEFAQRGVRIAALNLDAPIDRELARSFLAGLQTSGSERPIEFQELDPTDVRFAEVLLEQIVGRPQPLPVPFTMLIDDRGQLQSIYLGASIPDRFLADAQRFALDPVPGARRAHRPGRWFYRSPRSPEKLGQALAGAGLAEAAAFYLPAASP